MPLRTTPPSVWQPDCAPAVMADLQEVFRRHEWCSSFHGICVDCSDHRRGDDGYLWCHRDDAAPWPCSPVRAALTAAGIPVPPTSNGSQPLRILSEADNARVFGPSLRTA